MSRMDNSAPNFLTPSLFKEPVSAQEPSDAPHQLQLADAMQKPSSSASEQTKAKGSLIAGKILSGLGRALAGTASLAIGVPTMWLSMGIGIALALTAVPADKLLTHLQNKLVESKYPIVVALSWIPAVISIIPKAVVGILGSVAFLAALGSSALYSLAAEGKIKDLDSVVKSKVLFDFPSNLAFEGIAKKIDLFVGLSQNLEPSAMADHLINSMILRSYAVKADGMKTIFKELDVRIEYSKKMGNSDRVNDLLNIRGALIKALQLHLNENPLSNAKDQQEAITLLDTYQQQ